MATWPTSIPTDANLYLAVNELQTNLSSGINAAVTTLPLNSTTSFPTVGLVLIDNEIIKYTGVAGATLTGCTRAFDGTVASAHSSAAIVSFAFCAAHHNVNKDEIIALATYLSNNLGTGAQPLGTGSRALASNGSGKIVESSVTSTELGYLSGVTSAIQTQLAAKQATGNYVTALTGDVTASGPGSVAATLADSIAGTHTFSGQLIGKGTATNDNAAAGYIGEYVSSSATGVAAAANNAYQDTTTISLTAGDWDISCNWYESPGTQSTLVEVGISAGTSGNTFSDSVTGDNRVDWTLGANFANVAISIPAWRRSLSSTTTIRVKTLYLYSGGSPSSNVRISARRVR